MPDIIHGKSIARSFGWSMVESTAFQDLAWTHSERNKYIKLETFISWSKFFSSNFLLKYSFWNGIVSESSYWLLLCRTLVLVCFLPTWKACSNQFIFIFFLVWLGKLTVFKWISWALDFLYLVINLGVHQLFLFPNEDFANNLCS